ncbi:MAG: PEP-CTERM system histidine kinase PrsK [Gammaproteobacteria bacterium]|nr:PEP-CTERM system histidine kinase PrsK [Gammaproteobacteria bacterium]
MSWVFPYMAVAGASLLLFAYVLVAGAGSIFRIQFLSVALAGAVWSAWFGLVPDNAGLGAVGAFLAELILLLGWFGLLERLLRGPYLQSMPELVRRGVRWTWLLVVLLAGGAILAPDGLQPVLPLAEVLPLGILVLSLLSFVLTAQLFGDATVEPHAALRSICLAAVLVVGLQSYMYAVMLLVPAAPDWLVTLRIAGLVVGSALLAYCVHSNPQWSLAIFVSPQARIYAPRLMGAGAVLLLLVACIPLFRSFNVATAAWAGPVYVALLGLALLLILFSERLRAQLRVFVSKHFLPFRYDYREEWLRLIDTLASPGQDRPLPERAIQSLAQIVNSPAGVLWMRMGEDAPFVCAEAWNTKTVPEITVDPNDPVIIFMRDRQWILDTAELNRKPELYPGLTRPQWLENFPEGLLIVPLISSETVIGFVLLFQSSSAFRLTFEEIDLLRTSGRQVAAHLAQYHADRMLAEAKQFEAFNRLTAFVMHDLKNLIAQQSLMVKNAAKHKNNPDFFEDAMATIDNSVARMSKLLQQLQTGDASGPRRTVNLAMCIREALRKCEGRAPAPQFTNGSEDIEAHIDAERLSTVIAHLIRNAQEATDENGDITVDLSLSGSSACISVRDTGCGMEEEFIRNRLFKPFDTTKGSQGMGIGAYQARSFVVSSGGLMQVTSKPGAGTTVDIRLPAGTAGTEDLAG